MSKYGVIYKDSYQKEDPYDQYSSSTVNYDAIKTFETEQELKDWIIENNSGPYRTPKTVVAYIKYDELKATQTVTIDLK